MQIINREIMANSVARIVNAFEHVARVRARCEDDEAIMIGSGSSSRLGKLHVAKKRAAGAYGHSRDRCTQRRRAQI